MNIYIMNVSSMSDAAWSSRLLIEQHKIFVPYLSKGIISVAY